MIVLRLGQEALPRERGRVSVCAAIAVARHVDEPGCCRAGPFVLGTHLEFSATAALAAVAAARCSACENGCVFSSRYSDNSRAGF